MESKGHMRQKAALSAISAPHEEAQQARVIFVSREH
jgi:hypothetical protein